jgi:hypothetical protein
MMFNIISLARDGAFDAEATFAMGMALDRGWQMVLESRTAIVKEFGALPTREALAASIMEVAKRGERNPIRMQELALSMLLSPKARFDRTVAQRRRKPPRRAG